MQILFYFNFKKCKRVHVKKKKTRTIKIKNNIKTFEFKRRFLPGAVKTNLRRNYIQMGCVYFETFCAGNG